MSEPIFETGVSILGDRVYYHTECFEFIKREQQDYYNSSGTTLTGQVTETKEGTQHSVEKKKHMVEASLLKVQAELCLVKHHVRKV